MAKTTITLKMPWHERLWRNEVHDEFALEWLIERYWEGSN
jgi:hypothetical protein